MITGLYKTERARRRGPSKRIDDVVYATLEWVDWFNQRQLLGPIGNVRPAEFDEAHRHEHDPSYAERPTAPSLR
jgi:hypothetical protein